MSSADLVQREHNRNDDNVHDEKNEYCREVYCDANSFLVKLIVVYIFITFVAIMFLSMLTFTLCTLRQNVNITFVRSHVMCPVITQKKV